MAGNNWSPERVSGRRNYNMILGYGGEGDDLICLTVCMSISVLFINKPLLKPDISNTTPGRVSEGQNCNMVWVYVGRRW